MKSTRKKTAVYFRNTALDNLHYRQLMGEKTKAVLFSFPCSVRQRAETHFHYTLKNRLTENTNSGASTQTSKDTQFQWNPTHPRIQSLHRAARGESTATVVWLYRACPLSTHTDTVTSSGKTTHVNTEPNVVSDKAHSAAINRRGT